jgi:hypothetical protein
MNDRRHAMRNARLFLLIAVLAHGLGGDFGAWFHRSAPARSGVTVYAPGSAGDPAPAPAHARDCAVCQTLASGARALPERGIALRAGFAFTVIPAAEPRTAPRFLAQPPSLPRGPPAFS